MQLENVVTTLGILKGRDAVYLDKIEFDATHTVKLIGEINGNLLEKEHTTSGFLKFSFVFKQVLAFEMIELDSWFPPELWNEQGSSFARIINSQWIDALKGKVTPQHQHYLLVTYDDVFQIICETMEINIE